VYGIDSNWLEKACARLGDAAIDPAAWPDIIGEISAAVGATGAGLLQSDVRTADIPRSVGVDEGFNAYFAHGWHTNDIRAERGVPLARAGRIVITDEDIVTPEEMRRLPLYNELMAPHGLQWFAAVNPVSRRAGAVHADGDRTGAGASGAPAHGRVRADAGRSAAGLDHRRRPQSGARRGRAADLKGHGAQSAQGDLRQDGDAAAERAGGVAVAGIGCRLPWRRGTITAAGRARAACSYFLRMIAYPTVSPQQ
jgi:hypothetical protein